MVTAGDPTPLLALPGGWPQKNAGGVGGLRSFALIRSPASRPRSFGTSTFALPHPDGVEQAGLAVHQEDGDVLDQATAA